MNTVIPLWVGLELLELGVVIGVVAALILVRRGVIRVKNLGWLL